MPFREHAVLAPATAYLGSWLHRHIGGWRAAAALRRMQPDIVHIVAEPYTQFLPSIRGPWKTCMTAHGTYAVSPFSLGGEAAARAKGAYETLDGVIAVSRFTKEYVRRQDAGLFERAGLEKKIRVIPNAVDLTRAGVRRDPGDGIRRIIGVGALKERKGYLQSIDALAAFRAANDVPLRYDIIGSLDEDRAYVSAVRRRIADCGLQDVVHLRGAVADDELREAYATADLFLLLSLHQGFNVEGFGLVFLEANSWGIPVIGPTTGGCPEAISDGVSGYVCDPNDASSVAGRMAAILQERRIEPDACLRWAQEHSVDAMAATVAAYYRSL